MQTTMRMKQSQASFTLDLLRRNLDIRFSLEIKDPRSLPRQDKTFVGSQNASVIGKENRVDLFRFRLPLAQMQRVRESNSGGQIMLLISFDSPPKFYRKVKQIEATHDDKATFWSEWETWRRQTDVVYSPRELKFAPVSLKKAKPVIDIGRWTTYRFVFSPFELGNKYALICQALRDYNIEVSRAEPFEVDINRTPVVWDLIDNVPAQKSHSSSFLEEMASVGFTPLSFAVRYQLEVCISQGCLNEHNLSSEFITKLIQMEELAAKELLEHVASEKARIYNPMDIFNIKDIKGSSSKLKLPHYCVLMRSATVTPAMVYFDNPAVETTNRVVRQHIEDCDRFLRVRFMDEKFQGRIYSSEGHQDNEVFTRIKRTMANGITIGDRHFEFLAFGNSQLREHGAYFFAPLPHKTAADIRRGMGKFDHIKVVGKFAARMGQCFSTTRAINGTRVQIKETTDIIRNGYNFTDGVGKISPFLASMIAAELGLTGSREPPSVFQFRLGGCKGILGVSSEACGREIHIRPSQYKFPALHEGLEIIRWSQFAAASLNKQIILILSDLGVPDQVFVSKQQDMLSNLQLAMTDESQALLMLQRYIDPNQRTLAIAGMVLDGFQRVKEPFVVSLLHLWRCWSIKYLKEKAKVLIDQGAFLLGCVDETATLKGHFEKTLDEEPATDEEKLKLLPEIFIQVSDQTKNGSYIVIEGICLLARNPSLHPGDIRVVRAVNVPALHYMKDVVVLPQTGDRDLASMCSGGDLDGDDYFVMWDKDLTPTEWNHQPMDYTPSAPLEADHDITVDDITSFFVTYMKNDNLGKIATAHLALADFTEMGVKDEKCLQLADLHSKAVDFCKTSEPACMTKDLKPRKYPHFMENKGKAKEQIYQSERVLGQLYDQVERVDFAPVFDAAFDERILNAYQLNEKTLQDALDLKEQYDAAMRRIMAQHEINSEFEVWSTFVLHHAMLSRDYKFHEELGQISFALRDQFRNACYEKAGGKDFERLAPFVAAMYQGTQQQIGRAVAECKETKMVGGREVPAKEMNAKTMPLMSFPWLFPKVLGKIAKEQVHRGEPKVASAGMPELEVQPTPFAALVPSSRHTRVATGEDLLETKQGITNRGDILELFQDDSGSGNDPTDLLTGKALTSHSTRDGEQTEQTSSQGDGSHDEVALYGDLIDFGEVLRKPDELKGHGSTVFGEMPSEVRERPVCALEDLIDLTDGYDASPRGVLIVGDNSCDSNSDSSDSPSLTPTQSGQTETSHDDEHGGPETPALTDLVIGSDEIDEVEEDLDEVEEIMLDEVGNDDSPLEALMKMVG
ncbi:MAG: hypothetical protein M1819_006363 [Sarea resinae]|nr:MAG: hypothetical protein M1819_006363 [Sarea resinae]